MPPFCDRVVPRRAPQKILDRRAERGHAIFSRYLASDNTGLCAVHGLAQQGGQHCGRARDGVASAWQPASRTEARDLHTVKILIDAPGRYKRGDAGAQALGGRTDAAMMDNRCTARIDR